MLERETKRGDAAGSQDGRPLLLFFHSPRSGLARRMESLLATVAHQERDRLRVAAVEVDERPELAARFQVTSVPMLVLTDRGRVIGRVAGRARRVQIDALLAVYFARDVPLAAHPPEPAA